MMFKTFTVGHRKGGIVKNKTKEKLQRGEIVLGATIGTPYPEVVEVMARMPFDWLWFDTEHSPLNSEMLGPLLQVGRIGTPTPIVQEGP